MKEKNFFKAEDFDLDLSTCSTTDCTGLIPTPPTSEAELEAYENLYPYLPKETDKKNSIT